MYSKVTVQLSLIFLLALFFAACSTMEARPPKTSILVDLDPASADRTVIVESITANKQGGLYLPDRVTGNILRVDPKEPKAVVVGRIESREIKGQKVNADPSGVAFNQQGDLFIAVGPFSEIVRIRAADLDPQKPGVAQTFATGTSAANGITFDRSGNLSFRAAPVGSSIEWARMGARLKSRFKSKSMPGHFRMATANRRLLPMV
jgi:hypothetical protein